MNSSINLDSIATEKLNAHTAHIDDVSTLEMIVMINREDQKVALAIEKALPAIAQAVDGIASSLEKGGRLFYLGAGTSGRLGILDASECPPTFGVSPSLVQGIIAGGERAIQNAVEGAEDDGAQAREDLKKVDFSARDVLVGVAASGRTPYVIEGLNYARSLGAFTVGVSCSPASAVGGAAEVAIEVDCGGEVITGSTRLKAGTAQKMILNMLSTGTMIRLGKVYGNLMVDVQALNEKLVERCRRIVQQATGVVYEEAKAVLEKTQNNVKLAILLVKTGVAKEEGEKLLATYKGRLAAAIAQVKGDIK